MTMSASDAVHVDNQRAHDFAAKYMQAVNNELIARGAILSLAMQKFSAFLALQAIPPWWETCANIAFPVISVLAPELFLVKFLGEEEKTVKAALALSSALGNKGAKVLTAVQQVKEVGEKAEKVKKGIEQAKQVKENLDKLTDDDDDPPGVKELAKLDAGKAAVDALIDSSQRAYKIWSDALETLDLEYARRLSDLQHPAGESLEQLANRLLRHPSPLTRDERDQVEKLYLYEMIKAYVKTAVTIHVSIKTWGTGDDSTSITIDNLNNNQQAVIVDYFGPKARRGAIFFYPPIFNINLNIQLKTWGAKETTSVYQHLMHMPH